MAPKSLQWLPVPALVVAALLSTAAPASAQTPFRAGQWGADFFVGFGFSGAGLVHVRSPERAVALDLTADLNFDHRSTGGGVTQTNSGFLEPSIEFRRYRSMGSHLLRVTGLGIMANYSHDTQSTAIDTTHTTSYGAGVFGALGAQWLVNNSLSLGVRSTLTLSWQHQGRSGTNAGANFNDNTLDLSLGVAQLFGALYF